MSETGDNNDGLSSEISGKRARKTLFSYLTSVISLSHKKLFTLRVKDREKQSWGRLLVSAVSTYGGLLKDDELELRVIALEEQLENSILLPKGDKKNESVK